LTQMTTENLRKQTRRGWPGAQASRAQRARDSFRKV